MKWNLGLSGEITIFEQEEYYAKKMLACEEERKLVEYFMLSGRFPGQKWTRKRLKATYVPGVF